MRIDQGYLPIWGCAGIIQLGYSKLIVVGSKSKSKKLNNYLSCALFYLVLYSTVARGGSIR